MRSPEGQLPRAPSQRLCCLSLPTTLAALLQAGFEGTILYWSGVGGGVVKGRAMLCCSSKDTRHLLTS